MSDAGGICEYVLDPDDPETWGGTAGDGCYVDREYLNADGVWTCPHDTEDGGRLCIFHRPVDEKADEDVVDAFLTALDEATRGFTPGRSDRLLPFLGATFGDFDLSDNPPVIALRETTLDLSHARIEGRFDWSDSTFEAARVRFADVTFGGETSFRSTEFDCVVDFEAAQFNGYTYFTATDIANGADFGHVTFQQDLVFRHANFGDDAQFTDVRFEGHTDFRQAVFRGEADFRRAAFEEAIGFLNVVFGGNADFFETAFEGSIDFRSAAFRGGADFFRQNLDDARFNRADLTDARFADADCHDADFESALLSRATFFGTDLRGAKLAGAVLGDVRIDDKTQFLGHPSDDGDASPHTVSAIRSRPVCVYDPDYDEEAAPDDVDEAKSVYRTLEDLGGKHARPRLQARSFVRRQDLQKRDYWDDATADGASLEQRLIAGARWSRARVARATLLYGESPWRVIAWSLAIIVSFALLYPLGGWIKPTDAAPITYGRIASTPVEILNAVYYSTLTYTALGFGDFQPVGLGRLLTTLETGLGAVMVALLVFILGRRAAR